MVHLWIIDDSCLDAEWIYLFLKGGSCWDAEHHLNQKRMLHFGLQNRSSVLKYGASL